MIASLNSIVTDSKGVLAELWADGKGWVLLAVSAGWFLSIGMRYVFPALIPFFRTEFGFDLTTAGLLLTMLWGGYAVGQFPGGVLGDRIGEGNILVVSTAVSTVGIFVVATSINLWMLFAGTITFGFATALYGPTRFTIFTDIYTERAGTAVGLSMAAGSVGNTVLPALAGIIATYMTWRLGFGIVLPLFLGSTIALWLAVPNRTSTSGTTTDDFSIRTVRRLLVNIRRDGIPVIVLIQILISFVNQGVLGFYPIYLIDVKGFSPSTAATLFAFYFAVGIAVQPLSGMSRDRFGTKWSLLGILVVYFSGLLMISIAHTLGHLVIITMLLSARNGTGVVNNTFISNRLDDDLKGSGLGLLRSSWILAAATSPAFVGVLGDRGYFEEAFLLMAGLTAVAMLLSTAIPRDD